MGFICESKEEFIDMVESGEIPLIGRSFPMSSDFLAWEEVINPEDVEHDIQSFFRENPNANKDEFNWFLKDTLNEYYKEAVLYCEGIDANGNHDMSDWETWDIVNSGLHNYICYNWDGSPQGLNKLFEELGPEHFEYQSDDYYISRWNLDYHIVCDEDIKINLWVDEVLDYYDDFKQKYSNEQKEEKKQSNNLKM